MALTTMLIENREFKELIKSAMPSKKSFITNTGKPPFSSKNQMIVHYSLENSHQACLVGTASDYMFRFIIAKTINKNKDDAIEDIVAEKGLETLITKLYVQFNLAKEESNEQIKNGLEKRKAYFYKCKDTVKRYIYGEEQLFDSLVSICVWFAKLDAVFRNKTMDDIMIAHKKEKEPLVEKEVKQLCMVFIETFINSKIVTPFSDVVFNPSFGEWSKKVGGADADIFIDGTLYDFKSTKYVHLQWEYCAQIFAYFILELLDKQSDCKGNIASREIKNISLYYSRYGLINICSLSTSDANYDVNLLRCAKEIIEQEYKTLEDVIAIDGGKPLFPQFSCDFIDREKFGAATVQQYLSCAFPSFSKFDTTALMQAPIFWSGNYIPDILIEQKYFYIIRIKSCFYIEEGKEPFVYSRASYLYPRDKAMATSEIYNHETGQYYDKYVDRNGIVIKSRPTLTLTKDDYLLFLKNYKTSDLEIIDGCYFDNI